MVQRLRFILASFVLFMVISDLAQRMQKANGVQHNVGEHRALLVSLILVSALLVVIGTTFLALRLRNWARWPTAFLAAMCIISAVVLGMQGRIGIFVIASLYFGPQLVLLWLPSAWRRVPHP